MIFGWLLILDFFQTPSPVTQLDTLWLVLTFLSQPPLIEGPGRAQSGGLESQLRSVFPGNLTVLLSSPLLPAKTQDAALTCVPYCLSTCSWTEQGPPCPPFLLTVWLWTSHLIHPSLDSSVPKVWIVIPPFAGLS